VRKTNLPIQGQEDRHKETGYEVPLKGGEVGGGGEALLREGVHEIGRGVPDVMQERWGNSVASIGMLVFITRGKPRVRGLKGAQERHTNAKTIRSGGENDPQGA